MWLPSAYISRLSWWCFALVFTTLLAATCVLTSPAPSYNDYQQVGVSYDEYPVVVPKRAALLLDRIMVALQKAVDEENSVKSTKNRIPIEETMDLQRRGQQKGGRIYWRCYFNAVTCF
ncbi:allatostatin double C isoform X1 [Rhodnius prolixus]|uniref:Uncharacterized protein n=1 Tax=Rhodnius prolixus TaxID=13249 RepID=T1H8F9_RHOPR